MTAAQSLKIYEVLHKHFKVDADARTVVEQIEQIVEAKVDSKKDILLTKDDKVELLSRIDNSFKWLVGIMITLFGLTITIMFFLIKSKN
jgi:hypothetical protein